MSFFKTGDLVNISDILDDDTSAKCKKCGKKLFTIKLTDTDNEEVCECEINDDGE